MQKFAVINNKGGVGKSTTAVQFAHGLAKMDFKILLLDLDDQNDSSMFLGISQRDLNQSLSEYFTGSNNITLGDCVVNARENLDLLSNRDHEKLVNYFNKTSIPHMDLFQNKLSPLSSMGYDFVIIDCAPTKNIVNDAVIDYTDKIIMPVQVEGASVKGVGNMFRYLNNLDQPLEKISFIIPNMYDARTNESKRVLELLQDFVEDTKSLVTSPVHRRVKITEAGRHGKTVFEYDNEAGRQFFKIIKEVVENIG